MTRILITALFLLTTWSSTIAQDSIRIMYDQFSLAKGKERIRLANLLTAKMKEKGETDTLFHFYGKDKTVDFIILKSMADHYDALQIPDSALAFCKRATAVHPEGLCEEELADCLNNISMICQRTGRFLEALAAQKQCYEYDIKSGNPEFLSSSTNNLASLYLATRQFTAAKETILKSIEIECKLNRDDRLAIRYGLASEIFLNMDSLDEALRYAQMAYNLDKEGERTGKMAIRMSQMAAVLIKMNRLEEARANIEKALPLLHQFQNLNSEAISHNQLGQIYLQESKDAQAAEQFRTATALAKKIGNPLIEMNAQKGLSQALKDTNPTAAFLCLERYTELSDSIYKEESASQINQFHSINKAQELKENNIILNNKNESQRRYLRYVIVISILTVLLLASFIAILYHLLRARNMANSMMKKIEDMRLDFFTKVTHEFRTPLTIINGLSEIIANGKTETAQETQHTAQMILRNGQQLHQLTNQLLDISKLRTTINEPRWRHGNIVIYTKMIIETFSQMAFQKGVALHYNHLSDDRTEIDFVPDFHNKIVYNLLSNGLKYTSQGGTITMTTEIEGDKMILKVSDTGDGIAEEDLPHIFEEYYIGSHSDMSISTGVGLALVKQICDAVHGTIHVDSHKDEGSTFTLTLPAVCPHGEASPHFETGSSESPYSIIKPKRKLDMKPAENPDLPKILIVEDNEDVSQFISLLTKDKYQLIYASNGADGLKKAQETIPDLIVSDLMMPEMNGIELCREIRNDEMLSHIPFIIITANPDINERMKGLDCGADSYLLKPFNVDELIIRIKRLIEQREHMRKLFSKAIQEGKEEDNTMQMTPADQHFLEKLDLCIQRQIETGNTDVETISSELCVSSKQLRRKIFALTNMTSVAYILHVKLSKAKHLLKSDPEMPIAEISLKCGFEDSGYFTKTFKQHYGTTPSAYRKGGKNAN